MTRYAKTIIAALTALATWGVTAGADGVYDQVELWGLLGALTAAAGTYFVPNDPPKGEPADPEVSERGVSTTELALIVCAVCLVLLVVIAWPW